MPVPPALFLLALLRVLSRGVLVLRGQRAFNRSEGAFGGIREWTGRLQLQVLLERFFGAFSRYYFALGCDLGLTQEIHAVLILRVGIVGIKFNGFLKGLSGRLVLTVVHQQRTEIVEILA